MMHLFSYLTRSNTFLYQGVPRYFDEADNERQSTYACKHCGAEGDHKTIDCPVVIVSITFVVVDTTNLTCCSASPAGLATTILHGGAL